MLELYANIKKYRLLNNMSQQELAEKVGYKGKSMIAQIEKGTVNLSASMISKFAEVFHVTEFELMGVDEPEVSYIVYDDKMNELFEIYQSLPPDKQAEFLRYLKFLQSEP